MRKIIAIIILLLILSIFFLFKLSSSYSYMGIDIDGKVEKIDLDTDERNIICELDIKKYGIAYITEYCTVDPDEKYLFFWAGDSLHGAGLFKIWVLDLSTCLIKKSISAKDDFINVPGILIHPNRKIFYIGWWESGKKFSTDVYNLNTLEKVSSFSGLRMDSTAIQEGRVNFSGNGQYLYVIKWEKEHDEIIIIDTNTNRSIEKISLDNLIKEKDLEKRFIAYKKDQMLLIAKNKDKDNPINILYVFSMLKRKIINTFSCNFEARGKFSNHGDKLMIENPKKENIDIRVYEIETKKLLKKFTIPFAEGYSIEFSKDDKKIMVPIPGKKQLEINLVDEASPCLQKK